MRRPNCPSCGGKIGLDCFNPIECAQITASIQQNQYQILLPDCSGELVDLTIRKYEIQYGNHVKILISGANAEILNAVNGYGDNCKDEITIKEV